MALWNGLGQAATVAQLGGIDAAGLISMIVHAVQTVKQNKVECRQLVNHVMMIKDLLGLLQQSEMMQRPEVRRPIDGLEDTLRQAYLLVVSCQDSNIMYRFVMARSYAQQFRDVRDRIDSYLHIYPLISHLDTRHFIRGLYNGTDSLGAQPQASEEVLGSSIYDSNPGSQTERSIFGDNGIESVGDHAVTDPLAVEEQQQHDYGYQVLPNRSHRFRWLTRWARRETSTTYSINRLTSHETGRFIVFKYSLLVASTNNFSFIIGRGGYGIVYKGTLPNGVDVALKVRREAGFYISDFENEVKIVPELRHANIVKLLGCCVEGENEILVYEHMPGGSLRDRISEVRSGYPLTWPIRFRIIEGIVEGLVYLHKNSSLRVIHGDVKPSNILLDVYMTPRITDFGMAHVLSSGEDEKMVHLAGTCAYLDPQFICTSKTSVKTDVYSFGVTLLEIITTRPTYDSSMEKTLTGYAWELWLSGREMELLDPSLRDEPRLNEILRCIQIALLCLQRNREDRPTMFDVLMMLKCESMTLPIPTNPSGEVGSAANTGAIVGSTSYGSAELLTEEHDETSSYFSFCSSEQDNDDTSL